MKNKKKIARLREEVAELRARIEALEARPQWQITYPTSTYIPSIYPTVPWTLEGITLTAAPADGALSTGAVTYDANLHTNRRSS